MQTRKCSEGGGLTVENQIGVNVRIEGTLSQKYLSIMPPIEEGWRQKQKQRSSRLFGLQNLLNSMPR